MASNRIVAAARTGAPGRARRMPRRQLRPASLKSTPDGELPARDAAVAPREATRCGVMVRVATAAFVLLLAGCVADTMRGYVGQDVRAVMLAYGSPVNEIDLGGGARAFQWSKTSVNTTPVSTVTTTSKDKKGRKTMETQYVGGTQTVKNCLYTFVAAWNPERRGWIVTGFQQPSLSCALGGLS